VAIFAFLLATGRDQYRLRRERDLRDRSVVAAIREEVRANRGLLENNQELLLRELKLLVRHERLVNPLDPLGTGFWELVKLDPPLVLQGNADALSEVRRVARLSGQVNEMLRSRELYRTTSAPDAMKQAGLASLTGDTEMGSTDKMLAGYDRLLVTFQGELLQAIEQLEPALEQPSGRWRLRLRLTRPGAVPAERSA